MDVKTLRELKPRMTSRFTHWLDELQDVIKQRGLENEVQVNRYLLGKAVVDYFEDIIRLKAFEEIERCNEAKIYGYHAYWIMKRKPIQILPTAEIDAKTLHINELACATMIVSKMYEEKGIDIAQGGAELKRFFNLLYYSFKYREYTQKTLEIMIDAFFLGTTDSQNGVKNMG
ncbi:MAG: hypothetical protein K5696_11185 [Lachnospiraceae bacterium]|nr:hypothetical protein [Lachnospiraceae bacterium]